jgi:hypothetical protein
LCAFRARASDVDEIQVACSDEVTQSAGGLGPKLSLSVAGSVAGFRCIEAHQADIGLLVINPDSIAIYNSNVAGIDWLGDGWHRENS